ncbi:MAG: tRNA guanosine(34) transglycosylase Tgt [Deltaproteobacteria bacterium]|nr:tRNA guanosine(34) transglycosylase Tgt [Deltaproteobacteria bacterium]
MPALRYDLLSTDGRARRGRITTPHGVIETPIFMPVGTRATVTGLTPWDLREVKAQIILGNTYHLLLRPGPDVLQRAGGIHGFMKWDGPVLTDSGGFQIFSLQTDRRITEDGARFKSYVDGKELLLSPETSISMQEAIGSDIMMVLDHLIPSTSDGAAVQEAMDRTHRWALRSLAARKFPEKQALYAIVQGGLDAALRKQSAGFLTQHGFDGFAIGGLAVGDTREERGSVIELNADLLPKDKPRYLMGVGTPPDLIEAIGHGVDQFDCVLPTSIAWQSTAFTSTGRVRVSRRELEFSDAPLDAACACSTCRTFSRGYLHHLFRCKEPLGPRLLSVHNLAHYLDLMAQARKAIEEQRYAAFAKETLERIDRHEHGDGKKPGAQRGASAPEARHEIVLTREGQKAVRDRVLGEIMHPVVGPRAEAEILYAGQAGLRERLLAPDEHGQWSPLVLFDVGMGAASNALAAWKISESLAGTQARPLLIRSFERDVGALTLALDEAHASAFDLTGPARDAAHAILHAGEHRTERTRWSLFRGELPESLLRAPDAADVVFWDPWSPNSNPELWSVRAFSALRGKCGPRATLFTYGAATSTRAALLLAGFSVGVGIRTGTTGQTTAAAVRTEDLKEPLDLRWLERLGRSSAPLPKDAPVDARERIAHAPQFATPAAPPA